MNDKYFSFDGLGTVACEVLYQLCPCCFESLTTWKSVEASGFNIFMDHMTIEMVYECPKCDAAWAHYLELGK